MSNFPPNFLKTTPINVGTFSHIHAASEERLWYAGILFGTGEVQDFPFGPIDLSIPHDFYDTFNYSGAPLVVISGNRTVGGVSGDYNAAAPVWLRENLPTPTTNNETRLVVQEGVYYFASGNSWQIVSGGYPYKVLNSKNEIKKLRLSLSGLLYNTFPSFRGGYLDSGSVQQTRTIDLPSPTTDPLQQLTGILYNPLGLLRMDNPFFATRNSNIEGFVNVPDRLIDQNVSFAVSNITYKADTFKSQNLDQIDKMILCQEHILPIYTGVVQARYWFTQLYNGFAEAARDFGLIGAEGAETVTFTMNGEISWVGPQECFTIANGTVPKTKGTIGTHTLQHSITKTLTIDELINFQDEVVFELFSGVSRRGPNFDGFETPSDLTTQVNVYNTLPAPLAANTRAYTWNGTDFQGFISDGGAWNSATLLPAKEYQQRFIDVDNLGIIPRSPIDDTVGVYSSKVNLSSVTLQSSTFGPNGIKNLYGIFTENTLFFFKQEVSKVQFCKVNDTITFPEESPYNNSMQNSSVGGVNLTVVQNAPEIPYFVFDSYAFINWR